MDKDEALKLAYEALEFDGFYGTQKQRAITAIKQALAAQPAVQEPVAVLNHAHGVYAFRSVNLQGLPDGEYQVYTTPPAAQPAVQEPEIDGATMAGMDASIGHLSALVDELRLLLGCAMDNFKMLHNAAKPDDGPDMDAIIPAIVFAKFVNQDAALRYAIKHSAHDGMITTPPAAQPAVPDAIHHTDLSEHPQYIEGWNDCRAEMLKGMK
jgi:hypothetical protein